MRQEVSVDKAIWRGHLMVNLPILSVFIGITVFWFYLDAQTSLLPGWLFILIILGGFLLAWLVWSIMITRWRIWAFENVRNVHELKKRAVEEKLIWRDGHIFEKTEIRTKNQREKLKKLNIKFDKKDIYKEDYSLPIKTDIYYSKSSTTFQFIFSLFLVITGIYFSFFSEEKYQIWHF